MFGYPAARPSSSTTRCTTPTRSPTCSPATSRGPCTWPTATPAPPGAPAWPSSPRGRRHEHGDRHRHGLHGLRAPRRHHRPGGPGGHRHRLVPRVRHRGHHDARGQALLSAAIHRRAHPHHPRGLPHRRHGAPRPRAYRHPERRGWRDHGVRVPGCGEPALLQAHLPRQRQADSRRLPPSGRGGTNLCSTSAAASFHQRRPTRLWPSWTRCAFPPSSPSWARAACPRAIR